MSNKSIKLEDLFPEGRISNNLTAVLTFDPKEDNEELIKRRVHNFIRRCLNYLDQRKIDDSSARCYDIIFLSKFNPETKKRDLSGLCYIHFCSSNVFYLSVGLDLEGQVPDKPCVAPIRKLYKKKAIYYQVLPITFSQNHAEKNPEKDVAKLFMTLPSYITLVDLKILFNSYSTSPDPNYPRIDLVPDTHGKFQRAYIHFDPNTLDAVFAGTMFRHRQIEFPLDNETATIRAQLANKGKGKRSNKK